MNTNEHKTQTEGDNYKYNINTNEIKVAKRFKSVQKLVINKHMNITDYIHIFIGSKQ